jgi:hypothetical protein
MYNNNNNNNNNIGPPETSKAARSPHLEGETLKQCH